MHTTERCTAQRASGEFCDAPALEDMPFPICGVHAAQVYKRVSAIAQSLGSDPMFRIYEMLGFREEWQKEDARKQRCHDHLVYYVQIGDHIKIGVTKNLKQRLCAYPPNKRLLATEPGDYGVEAQRHRQFVEYRAMGNEWYHPAPRLIEHINKLRVGTGKAPIPLAA